MHTPVLVEDLFWDASAGGPILRPADEQAREVPRRVLIRNGASILGEVMVRSTNVVLADDPDVQQIVSRPARPPWSADLERPRPFVSVVVATRNRSESLEVCVASLLASDYPDFEIVLVDSGSAREHAARHEEIAAAASAKLITVSEPGASRARNAGVDAASGEVVAFTDDDVEVDAHWLAALVDALLVDGVSASTGLVAPAELETEAQLAFESLGGFGKGFTPKVFTNDSNDPSPLYPFAPGMFGSGNNCAWWREDYLDLGGMDTRLGPGTRSRSGEDLELFLRCIRSGGCIVYTPDALVRHYHRRHIDELRRQLFGYGCGLSGLFVVHLINRPGDVWEILRRVPRGMDRLLGFHTTASEGSSLPATVRFRMLFTELTGFLLGPLLVLDTVLRSRGAKRRSGGRDVPARRRTGAEAARKGIA